MNKIIGQKGENLVFLMCLPRSGSTLLSMMLSAHTKISCPPEPWLLLFAAEWINLASVCSAPYGRNNALIAALDFLLCMEYEKSGTLEELMISAFKGSDDTNNKEIFVREFVRNAYSTQLALSGKIVFIDKTPRNYTILPFIDKYFPLSKKIFLKRNPLDIALSYLTAWKIPINELVGNNLTANSRDFVEGMFALSDYFSSPDTLKHVVAYEDIVSDGASQLAEICQFIDVDYQPLMLKFYENESVIQKFRVSAIGDTVTSRKPKAINSDSVGRGLTGLMQSDLQHLLTALGGNVFLDLGYSDVLIALDRMGMGINVPDEKTAQLHRRNVVNKLHSKTIVEHDRKNLLGLQIESLTMMLKESEVDRALRLEQIESLTGNLRESEFDRTARGQQIEELIGMLRESESDRTARSQQIEELTGMLRESESDRAARSQQIEELTGMLRESESDRAARSQQIEKLTRMLREAESDRTARRQQIEELTGMLRESESDRAARGQQIEELTVMLRESEPDRAARGEQIKELTRMLRESESDRTARHQQIEKLTRMLRESESDRTARSQQIEELTGMLRESESDRIARSQQIENITGMLHESESDRTALSQQIEELTGRLRESESDRAARGEQIKAMKTDLRALFSRARFNWLTRYANWPEIKKLAEHFGTPNE